MSLVATVLAVDPHPFDGPTGAPSFAVAAQPLISGATATTVPPTVTLAPPTTGSAAPASSTAAPPPAAAPIPPTAAPASTVTAPVRVLPPAVVAKVAVPVVAVYTREGDGAPAFGLAATTELGNPRVLLTTVVDGDWIAVLLPIRPNNAVGWVRSRDVELSTVADRVDVDLATRTLTWTRGATVVLQVPAGIGADSTPTPTGTYFVTDVLAADPAEGRGRWIVALNGHSDAYATFEGGDARIAIHGTSDPSSVGAARSNGCVRLADGPLDQLRSALPPGTPVVVR